MYPEVKTFGPTIPAFGVWMRHVRGVTINNIVIKTDTPDLRPVFLARDAADVRVSYIESTVWAGSESAVRFDDCRNIYFVTRGLEGETDAVVEVSGRESAMIDLPGRHRLKAGEKIRTVDGADPRAAVMLESEAAHD